jgi:peptidoglycan/xylan/chitin deacetylase (PgdA/CDA1 family)
LSSTATLEKSHPPAQAPSSVVFLMYHELGLRGRAPCHGELGYVRYVVDEENFWQQMRVLQLLGLRGTNVSDSISSITSPSVAITFDDGCGTDLTHAAPILQSMGFGATFFITVGFLGKPGYLSRSQVRELHDLGFDIGCHSMTHPHLPDLDGVRLRREIIDAKLDLEQITGAPVRHFSCPGGRYDARVVALAREAGYLSLSTSRAQANSSVTDAFALGRIPILRETKLGDFSSLCRGHGLRRLALQTSLRDEAKRFLGNSSYDRLRALLIGDRQ